MGENQSQCLPLFLTSHIEGGSSKQYFYNLLENRYQTKSIPIMTNKAILGSFYGWLVLLDPNDGDCCLWNPTLNQTIQIPLLENPRIYYRCFMSKSPTDPDCFIVFSPIDSVGQLVYRIGDNTFFKLYSEGEGYRVIAMVSFRGMIYGLVEHLDRFQFEFVTIHMAGGKLEKTPFYIQCRLPSEVLTIPWNLSYLIESPCDDELFLVTKILSNCYLESRVHFRVFRMDVTTNQLEEVDNIGDRTIFISVYGGNGLCRSSESSIKPNCIYYTNGNGKVIYIYDLDDRGTITMLPYPNVHINPNMAAHFWVDIPDILNYSGLV